MPEMGTDWTTLEAAKLIVAILVPLTVVIAGLFVSTRLQKQSGQKLVDKRIEVFDLLAPDYNTLLVYLLYWGNWKEITPPEIIELKRRVDRNMHVYSWLFATDIQSVHREYISECFQEFRRPGVPAGIRSSADKRRTMPGWQPAWDDLFTNEHVPDRKDALTKAYGKVMMAITVELKTDAKKHPFLSGVRTFVEG